MIDVLIGLAKGMLVMMPQNFYAEAFYVKEDEYGDDMIASYPSGKRVTNTEILAMLLDSDVYKKVMYECDFGDETVQAFLEYFSEDGIEYEGPQKTDCVCKRCGTKSIVKEDQGDYPFYCMECDQNMYSFELDNCPEDSQVCAAYDEDESSADCAFFDVFCPDGSGKTVELEVSVLTDQNVNAWVRVVMHYNDQKIFVSEQSIGEWSSAFEWTYSLSQEYINLRLKGSDKNVTVQVKVQKDEPGIIVDMFKYEPCSDEGEIVEALGYVTMEDCDE